MYDRLSMTPDVYDVWRTEDCISYMPSDGGIRHVIHYA